jgi:hypothetical protein
LIEAEFVKIVCCCRRVAGALAASSCRGSIQPVDHFSKLVGGSAIGNSWSFVTNFFIQQYAAKFPTVWQEVCLLFGRAVLKAA